MSNKYILREFRLTDEVSLTENANNINVWNNVRDYFPHPYGIEDAREFIAMNMSQPKPNLNLVIEVDGNAAGCIGIVPQTDIERISAEIGYWLGEKYWNRGIMTEVVKDMTEYAFSNFQIRKLYAPVFDFNKASQRVLEKAGFTKEAILKQAAIKNHNIIDLHYYSLIKRDLFSAEE